MISVNEELSIEFLDRVYFILDRLPEHLKPTIATRNRQVLEIQHNDGLVSTIKSLPTTEMGAQSKTPTLLVLDETSRNRLVSEIYSASLPGIDAAGGRPPPRRRGAFRVFHVPQADANRNQRRARETYGRRGTEDTAAGAHGVQRFTNPIHTKAWPARASNQRRTSIMECNDPLYPCATGRGELMICSIAPNN